MCAMSEFSSLLSKYVRQNYVSIRALAQRLNMSAATLTKLCNGTRSPRNQRANVERICEQLMLSPAQTRALWELFDAEVVGADVYTSRISMKQLIETMSGSSASERCTPPSWELPKIALPEKQKDVYVLLLNFLNNAVAEGSGRIEMILSPENPVVIEEIRNALRSYDIKICHVIPLRTSDKSTGNIDAANIDNIRCVIPLILDAGSAGSRYEPYYYYVHGTGSALDFSNILISDNGVLLCTQDFSHGMCFSNKELQQYWRRIFRDRLAGCRPLCTSFSQMEGQINYISNLLDESEGCEEFFYLCWQPCLLDYTTPDMIMQYMAADVPFDRDACAQGISAYMQRLGTRKNSRAYFTKEGLMEFVRTGRLEEVPEELVDGPLPVELRLRLLENMMAAAEQGHLQMHIAREERIKIGRDAALLYYGADTVAVAAMHYKFPRRVFYIQELSTNWSALNLMESFDELDWFFSAEETYAEIQKMIEKEFGGHRALSSVADKGLGAPFWASSFVN